MRQLTEYEKAALDSGYSENPMPTQAITIEWQFMYRAGGSGQPINEAIFYWEEMLFPADLDAGSLKIHEIYMENPIFFASQDSPSEYGNTTVSPVTGASTTTFYPAVTGQSKMFLDIANDTLWWNPEKDAVSIGPDNRGFKQGSKTTVTPPQIWARVIKVYNFAVDGSVDSIDYYVMDEEGAAWGGYIQGLGKVKVTKSGDYYYIPLLSTTNDGTAAVIGIDVGPYARVAAHSVLPEGDAGVVHLLSNAREAAEYERRVTLTGVTLENDANADRQRARENFAEALWG